MRVKDIQNEAYLMGQLWSLLKIIDSLNWYSDTDRENQIEMAHARSSIKKVYESVLDSYWETQQNADEKGE